MIFGYVQVGRDMAPTTIHFLEPAWDTGESTKKRGEHNKKNGGVRQSRGPSIVVYGHDCVVTKQLSAIGPLKTAHLRSTDR